MTDLSQWETAVNVGRIVNIVLATTAMYLLVTAVRGWKYRSAGNRFLYGGVGILLFGIIYGSAEQIWAGVGGLSWRTAVTTVGVSWIIAALWSKKHGGWHDDEAPRQSRR